MNIEFAWACGLFEGEGTVMNFHYPPRTQRGLQLGMNDRDVVERFCQAVGVGKVGPPRHRKGAKPYHVWTVRRWDLVEPLLRRMIPMMGTRRREAMEALLANPPTTGRYKRTCDKGHPLTLAPGDSGRRCQVCR